MVGRTKRRTSREKKIWRRKTTSVLEGERRKEKKREKGSKNNSGYPYRIKRCGGVLWVGCFGFF